MVTEADQNIYKNSTATVVGGKGELGNRIVKGLRDMGFGQVIVCEKGDPFTEIVSQSDTVFFAVDDQQTGAMLQTARNLNLIKPGQNILDGASVKRPLFSLYHTLDQEGVSVCSTHFGAVPNQPPRGIKVWLCEVGPNSEAAKRIAFDLYIAKNASIRVIPLESHPLVEKAQWVTMVTEHLLASLLRKLNFPLEKFHDFGTLNAELAALPLGRTLGQGTKTPSEILFNQPDKDEFTRQMRKALEELEDSLADRDKLKKLMDANIQFHGGPYEAIGRLFKKAGIVGARNANLRMYAFSLRITDDRPGRLIELLVPFRDEQLNITAIDSMTGIITPSEEERGVDPDKIVDFDIGIDMTTYSEKKERRLKARLYEMGCTVNYSGHILNR